MMWLVETSQRLDAVECHMNPEEQRVVDEERGQQFQYQSARGWWICGKGAVELEGGVQAEVVDCWEEKVRFDELVLGWVNGGVASRFADCCDGHAGEFLDHYEVHG